ncbi:MAG: MBL fold metallo-hydrolase [Alphaproteobacteria bacterium]
MTPRVQPFFDDATNNVTYVVSGPEGGACAIIDPVLDFDSRSGRTGTSSADTVIAWIEQQGLTAEWVLETHVHADHMTAAAHLKDRLGCRIAIGAGVCAVQAFFAKVFNIGADFAIDGAQFDHLFSDGEEFAIGGLKAVVIATPGHTPACVAYHIGDAVFTGDTLFMPDSGTARCDFPAGSAAQLYKSIRRLLALPGETRLFINHDYGADGVRPIAWETSVAEQRAGNIHVADGIGEAEYVELREARDATLSMPRLILPAIQVNMRAGRFPASEDNGVSYLKLPIDML